MNKTQYDVVIVGARCGGAALATFLARDGAPVLLLDKDKLPSDQVMSTHTIHPPGVDVLDELGVGKQVRLVAPPMRVIRLAKNDAFVDNIYTDGRAEYCPRRERLDGLLQQAAVDAGAELIDRVRVTSLIDEKGRVVGVRANRDGEEYEFRAGVVVGADGRRSTVATLVQAEQNLAYDAPRGAYWGYWEAPEIWTANSRYPFDMFIGNRGGSVRVIFITDYGQLLIASMPTIEECARWRSDPLSALKADLARDPLIGPLVAGRDPVEKIRGTIRERYFFRRATGPGWVLIGDAGHHKDFVIGDGITEALLQARSVVPALKRGTDDALEQWWRFRDVEALPLYFFADDEGRAGPPSELQCVVLEHVARDPELKQRMALVLEHKLSPYDVFRVPTVLQWALGAAVRGKPSVLREFLAMGKRASTVARELVARKDLLDRATLRNSTAVVEGQAEAG